ncbi:MAG: aminomethyltransferase [Gaiellales bacterium]|nr:aminomethyltransferase [Gaiellales bacterium]
MTETLRATPLHARHVSLGARMVPFAGWSMPVQYTGVIEEHRAVRASAGVFDVSHMGRFDVRGEAAHAGLQRLLSNDLDALAHGQAQYTLLTNAAGGIVDDLIVYRGPEGYLLVVNAANRAGDLAHLGDALPEGAELTDESDDTAMLALQGPESLALLARVSSGPFAADLAPAFSWGTLSVAGVECTVARTGYTGEAGVELICRAVDAERLWDGLTAAGAVPCGLGARDTLRLEVCYPLHGNDIGPDTNAIEAGLGWVCAREKDFSGSDVLRRTREQGPARRLVAFRMLERAIPRAGCEVVDEDGAIVGHVTSGTMSPSLGEGIGMGYVPTPLAEPGTAIVIDVRGRRHGAEVARKPLYRKES